MPSKDRLLKFKVTDAETVFAFQGDVLHCINDDPKSPDPKFETDDFLDYLEGAGQGYEVSTTIEEQDGNYYLQMNCSGNAWQLHQREFNNKLQYMPSPLDESEMTRDKDVLILKKSLVDQQLKLGTTDWILSNSRIQKSEYNGQSVNDVIMYWKHAAWNNHTVNGKKPNQDKYVVTCWKWLD